MINVNNTFRVHPTKFALAALVFHSLAENVKRGTSVLFFLNRQLATNSQIIFLDLLQRSIWADNDGIQ